MPFCVALGLGQDLFWVGCFPSVPSGGHACLAIGMQAITVFRVFVKLGGFLLDFAVSTSFHDRPSLARHNRFVNSHCPFGVNVLEPIPFPAEVAAEPPPPKPKVICILCKCPALVPAEHAHLDLDQEHGLSGGGP